MDLRLSIFFFVLISFLCVIDFFVFDEEILLTLCFVSFFFNAFFNGGQLTFFSLESQSRDVELAVLSNLTSKFFALSELFHEKKQDGRAFLEILKLRYLSKYLFFIVFTDFSWFEDLAWFQEELFLLIPSFLRDHRLNIKKEGAETISRFFPTLVL